MPKPLLLVRPSGLYVRFKLPPDIRRLAGVRFLVRSLGSLRADAARLTAATLGYALSQAFDRIRAAGANMDTKKELDEVLRRAAVMGRHGQYEVTVPGVLSVKADGPEDHQRAMEALAKMHLVIPGMPAFGQEKPASAGPMLHASIATFLKQIAASERAAATLLETKHTLCLFRDLTDDMPMVGLGSLQTDAFREAMTHWPARARVMPKYKGLSARQIIALSRKSGDGGLAVRTMEKHLDRLRVFFNWSVKRRELPHNPLTGVRLQTAADKYTQSRRAFTPDELRKLFDPDRRTRLCADDPLYFWLPLFALLTGARLKEMAQLQVTDVDQVGGV